MNDSERRQWVENDEVLYNWYRSLHQGLYRFVQENRPQIDAYIAARLSK